MKYFDAHLHFLDEKELQLARVAGVENFICNATKPQDWLKVLSLKNVIHAVGIHPWYIENIEESSLHELENLLTQNPDTHIGEIGLDKCKANFYKQEEIFEKQLELAQKLNRPVHIHCVRAWSEILSIIKKYKELRYLFHSFSSDKNTIRFLSDYDAWFSVNSATKLPLIPTNKLLIESDAPDKLPSPTNLPFLYLELGVNADQIAQNFERFIHGK